MPPTFTTKRYEISADDLNQSRPTGAHRMGDVFRVVSSRNMASNAAWPNRFEATQSGVYRIRVDAMLFHSDAMHYAKPQTPLQLGVYARPRG